MLGLELLKNKDPDKIALSAMAVVLDGAITVLGANLSFLWILSLVVPVQPEPANLSNAPFRSRATFQDSFFGQ